MSIQTKIVKHIYIEARCSVPDRADIINMYLECSDSAPARQQIVTVYSGDEHLINAPIDVMRAVHSALGELLAEVDKA